MRSNAVIIIAAALIGAGLVAGPVAADDMPGGRFAQTITMPHIPDTTVDSAVVVDASASSLLPVEISVSGACAVMNLLGGAQIVATGSGA